MLTRDHYSVVDLSKPIQPETLNGVLSTFDNMVNTFRTKLVRGGSSLTLIDHDVYGLFQTEDGYTWRIKGELIDGAPVVSIPNHCLMKPGRFTLTIKAGNKAQEGTLRIIRGYVMGCCADDAWKDVISFDAKATEDGKGVTLIISPMVDTQAYKLYQMSDDSEEAEVVTVTHIVNSLTYTFSNLHSGEYYWRVAPLLKVDNSGRMEEGNKSEVAAWFII